MTAARVVGVALCAMAALTSGARSAAGQGMRVTSLTSVRYLDLRPLKEDSVPVTEVDINSAGPYYLANNGEVVRCTPGFPYCYYRSSGAKESTLPVLQDIGFAAWGFGRGLSAQAHLRFRGAGGEQDLLPRQEDHFDALEAYLQYDGARLQARAGRQWAANTLGAYNFDGLTLQYRFGSKVSAEGFGGWSLVQGLNEPHTTDEIGQVDDLPPEDRGVLVGGRVLYRPTLRSAITATYQREIRQDRVALYSERAGVDFTTRFGQVGVDGIVVYDFATTEFNDVRLRARSPVVTGLQASAEVRRYNPFFELWTVWGAFSPVSYTELRGTLHWTPGTTSRFAMNAYGSWRDYDETGEGLTSDPLEGTGWRIGSDASLRLNERWTLFGDYFADVGFGASRSDGSAGVRYEQPRWYLGASGTAMQNIYEFRVGQGRIFGAIAEGGMRLWDTGSRLVGDVGIYRHALSDSYPGEDWSQTRASLRLELTLGRDPGMGSGGAR